MASGETLGFYISVETVMSKVEENWRRCQRVGNWGRGEWRGKRQRTVSESSYGGNPATHPPPTVQQWLISQIIYLREEIPTKGRLTMRIN